MGKKIILKQVHVYDVYEQEFSKPTDILIEEGLIAKIGEILQEERLKCDIIDCVGKYAVPGLFDSHTHLASLVLYGEETKKWLLQSYLDNGITQIRDVGGQINDLQKLTEDITNGRLHGPDIFYSGPLLEKSPLTWGDINEIMPEFTVPVNTCEDAEEVVETLVRKGASFIKAGFKWDIDVFSYLLQKVSENGSKLTLDPGRTFFQSIPVALGIELGVNCFEHAKHLLTSVFTEEFEREYTVLSLPDVLQEQRDTFIQKVLEQGTSVVDQTKLAQLISIMVEKNIYYCPTLTILEPETRKFIYIEEEAPHIDITEEEKEHYSRFRKEYERVGIKPSKKELEGIVHFLHRFRPFLRLFTQKMAEAKVRILPGHDWFYGTLAIRELELLQEYGLTPGQILTGATLYSAEWLGIQEKYGSLKENYKANILIVNANPLTDIHNIKTVYLVIKDGVIVSKGHVE
jgi:hypothetical protein